MPVPSDGYSSSGGYITNKEQLRNEDGSGNETVKFYNQSHRVATYVNDTLVAYQLVQAMDSTDQDTTFRVDMKFTKGSPNAKVFPFSERKEYHNYYLGHMSVASERTTIVNNVIKSGVYTNTDVIYTHSPSGFRHLIVARSGAPTGDFEMTFTGQSSLSVDGSGKLVIATSIGNITFTKAKAYTMNNTTGVLTLLGWQPSYSISGNAVSFTSFGSWSGTLVLEFGEAVQSSSASVLENVDWSTMFGAGGNDQFKDVVCNDDNDVFAFGETNNGNLPDNVGEQFGAWAGNTDVVIVKFNDGCEANFMTYYGGSGNDYARGGEIDVNDGELYVVGTTASSNLNFDTSIPMDDDELNGSQDGFYAKFSSNGLIVFHTYVGGSGQDVCTGVSHAFFPGQNLNLIYYVGHTNNGSGWPALVNQANSVNMPYRDGVDGFIIKRSGGAEEVVWSTFFGSDEDDWITDVDLMRGSPVFVGITGEETYSSVDGTLPTDGLFPKAHGSNWNDVFFDSEIPSVNYNYFVGYFGDDGSQVNQFFDQFRWSTYIAPSNDGLFTAKASVFVDSDGFSAEDIGDAFITGQVPIPDEGNGEIDYPFIENGWHQAEPGGGASDAFFMKFRMPGQIYTMTRSTLFGGDADEWGGGFAIDPNDNVYMCGQAKINDVQDEVDWCVAPTDGKFPMCDLNGLLYTETNIVGQNQRAFVCAFKNNGEMRWSTEYGDGDANAGNAMTANSEKVWMVGYSNQNWTDEEFDDTVGSTDYFRIFEDLELAGVGQEATIARFDIPLILGIDETMAQNDISALVYPNPTSGSITLAFQNMDNNVERTLRLVNALGQVVLEMKTQNQKAVEIDMRSFADGLYSLQIVTDETVSSVGVVKE